MKAISVQLGKVFSPNFFRNLVIAAVIIALMSGLLYILIHSPA